MMHGIEIAHDPDVVAVLDALGIPVQAGRPQNGSHATVVIALDDQADARLLALIDSLIHLRWHYTPGRELQLELDLFDEEGTSCHS